MERYEGELEDKSSLRREESRQGEEEDSSNEAGHHMMTRSTSRHFKFTSPQVHLLALVGKCDFPVIFYVVANIQGLSDI